MDIVTLLLCQVEVCVYHHLYPITRSPVTSCFILKTLVISCLFSPLFLALISCDAPHSVYKQHPSHSLPARLSVFIHLLDYLVFWSRPASGFPPLPAHCWFGLTWTFHTLALIPACFWTVSIYSMSLFYACMFAWQSPFLKQPFWASFLSVRSSVLSSLPGYISCWFLKEIIKKPSLVYRLPFCVQPPLKVTEETGLWTDKIKSESKSEYDPCWKKTITFNYIVASCKKTIRS